MDILVNIIITIGIIIMAIAISFVSAIIRCFPAFLSDKPKKIFIICISTYQDVIIC